MRSFIGYEIKQIDSHVHGNLYEFVFKDLQLKEKILLIENTCLPKEMFLYLYINKIIVKESIFKRNDFSHFEKYYQSLFNPSKRKVAGEYFKEIKRIKNQYNFHIDLIAIDEEKVEFNFYTNGCFNYNFKTLITTKSLFELFIEKLNPKIKLPKLWSDIEYKILKIKPFIEHSQLFKPYKKDIINVFDIIQKSPIMVTFSNCFRVLVPNLEALLKDFIKFKNIKGIKTTTLSTIVGNINNYKNNVFSKEFIEYLKIILEPTRNMSLHGINPSERVCNFLVIVILEMYEELLEMYN